MVKSPVLVTKECIKDINLIRKEALAALKRSLEDYEEITMEDIVKSLEKIVKISDRYRKI